MTIGSSSAVESVEAPEARTEPARLTAEEAAALARGAGLEELGVRPGLVGYAREVWGYRHLVWHLSSAQAWATNQNNYLGQLWAVLNPLLLVGSYYLIFGLLLKTRGGTSNYIAFLTIGIFVFGYSASAIIAGSRAVVGQIGLVRALRFPRAVLPISVTLTQFLVNVPAFAVLMVMIPLTRRIGCCSPSRSSSRASSTSVSRSTSPASSTRPATRPTSCPSVCGSPATSRASSSRSRTTPATGSSAPCCSTSRSRSA